MARFPVGPSPFISVPSSVRNIPLPPFLILILSINALVLFVSCFLLLFLQPMNTSFVFSRIDGGLISGVGVLFTGVTIAVLAMNRRIGRGFAMASCVAIATFTLVLTDSVDSLLAVFVAFFATASCVWCCATLPSVKQFYAVLREPSLAGGYNPYRGYEKLVLGFSRGVSIGGEIATVALAFYSIWLFTTM